MSNAASDRAATEPVNPFFSIRKLSVLACLPTNHAVVESATTGNNTAEKPPGPGLILIPSLQLPLPVVLIVSAGVPFPLPFSVLPAGAQVAKLVTVPPLVPQLFPLPKNSVPFAA